MRTEIAASEGARLRRELSTLGRTFGVFSGNARELQDFLRKHMETAAVFELWNLDNREGFDRFLDEVDRLLHNYLASVASLRDHTRRVWGDHGPNDTKLRAEYEQRKDESFASSPLARFVQQLRNYALHRRLPVAYGTLSWTPETGEVARVVLDRDTLLEWDGWDALARQYLDDAPEQTVIIDLIDEYTQRVVELDEWVRAAFVRGHEAAFADLELVSE
jgi:hypothetical protein